MSDIAGELLTLLLVYGYPILVVTVLFGAAGLPLPAGIVAMAAGAFAADRELDIATVFALAYGAAVVGDATGYSVSRWAGEAAVVRFGGRIGFTPARIGAVRARVDTWIGLAVFFSRWLLSPLGGTVNVVAGVGEYPFRSFLFAAIAGEAIWAAGYIGAGYMFGQSWPIVAELLGDGVGLAVGVVLVLIAIVVGVRAIRARLAGAPARRLGPADDPSAAY